MVYVFSRSPIFFFLVCLFLYKDICIESYSLLLEFQVDGKRGKIHSGFFVCRNLKIGDFEQSKFDKSRVKYQSFLTEIQGTRKKIQFEYSVRKIGVLLHIFHKTCLDVSFLFPIFTLRRGCQQYKFSFVVLRF